MNSPTKKQEETLREFLHEAVVPLIEDVLVKKLGQAMSYAKEQLATPKQWVGLTEQEITEALEKAKLPTKFSYRMAGKAIEAKLKEKNNV